MSLNALFEKFIYWLIDRGYFVAFEVDDKILNVRSLQYIDLTEALALKSKFLEELDDQI